jgi:hypothetical protein
MFRYDPSFPDPTALQFPMHTYEGGPRKDHHGVDLISDVLPFGKLWYAEPNAVSNPIGYAKHRSRSHDAVIRVLYATGSMIETHKHAGDFKEPHMRSRLHRSSGTRAETMGE